MNIFEETLNRLGNGDLSIDCVDDITFLERNNRLTLPCRNTFTVGGMEVWEIIKAIEEMRSLYHAQRCATERLNARLSEIYFIAGK